MAASIIRYDKFVRIPSIVKKQAPIQHEPMAQKHSDPVFPFKHRHLLQTAMPMGGIGAGCICLNGYGGLQNFSTKHRPHTTAYPDREIYHDTGFALLHIKGASPATRLVEGPLPAEKIYDQGLQAQGYRHGGHEGLPRFRRNEFRSGYPFGQVALSDPRIPLRVEITGWSPFIPLDDIASGIPCSILEYTFHNSSKKKVDFEFSYHLCHFAVGRETREEGTRNRIIPGKGVYFHNTEASHSDTHGSASLTVVGQRPVIKAMWLRGHWFDGLSALWREASTGNFRPNDGKADAGKGGRNGGSILLKGSLAPGEKVTFPIVIAWHFPNIHYTVGGVEPDHHPDSDGKPPRWRPFYAGQWRDAEEVASYVHRHYADLRGRTAAFQNALLSSSLPPEVLDAVSANLAILKSPTVLRQDNGNLWGWEGCFTDWGCCHGSCTHVWNYAQAFPHLFPRLERTLREQELIRSMDETGYVVFRSALPDGPPRNVGHPAAADGQLGGIMKLYRDWQISGDTVWLREIYPLAKRSLDYCIDLWDPQRRGALFEPHHNTYDIDFWGPDGMCTTIYIGALCAMSAMARALKNEEDRKAYADLAERGTRFIDRELFNGSYYEQKVQYRGLKDTSFLKSISGSGDAQLGREMIQLLKKEGPRYQYGKGCLSDGVIGAWMAGLYGIETPFDARKIRSNLRSIHRHNFRRNLEEHSNIQRPGYALGREAGLLLCSWPQGGKPTLPFVYSDEVWTGIEYQVASHLVAEGLVREGLEIVKAVRSRYDGRVRNPWNEYECGSYYARAMASYALLLAYSGFRYSAVEQTLWFGPKTTRRPFQSFFSTASGYGTILLEKNRLIVSVIAGVLELRQIVLTLGATSVTVQADARVLPGQPATFPLPPSPRSLKSKRPGGSRKNQVVAG